LFTSLFHIILRYNKDTINQAKEIARQFFGTEKSFEHRVEPYILKAVKEHGDAFSSVMPDFFKDASVFHNTFLGIDLNKVPTFHPDKWTGEAVGLIIIALSSAVLQLILTIYMQYNNKKNNPAAASVPGMNAMFYISRCFGVDFNVLTGRSWTLLGSFVTVFSYTAGNFI
jgi:YidC/Oxa1 family membrane protein insertase